MAIWDSGFVVHWCERGRRPLNYGGDQDSSLQVVLDAIVLSIGGPMAVPLLYRWKGFARAVVWALRGVRHHSLLPQAWFHIVPNTMSFTILRTHPFARISR